MTAIFKSRILGALILFTFFSVAFHAVAAPNLDNTGDGGGVKIDNTGGGGANTTNTVDRGVNLDNVGDGNSCDDATKCLMNPLVAKDIGDLFYKIIDVLLVFAIPIIVLYIMYGGFKLVTAGGEAGQIEEGRTMIMWAIVGGVILMGAKVIVEIIQQLVKSL